MEGDKSKKITKGGGRRGKKGLIDRKDIWKKKALRIKKRVGIGTDN